MDSQNLEPEETTAAENAAEAASAEAPEASGNADLPQISDGIDFEVEPEEETEVEAARPEPPIRNEEVERREALDKLVAGKEALMAQLRKVIVGQDDVIEQLLIVLFSGGHCLLSGAPGLAKTLLIRTISEILDLDFNRIQFTPDLMPSDITGTEIIDQSPGSTQRELRFIQGPIFAQVLLADEINRTPPKTQAALLEAMEEKQVTAGGQTLKLPDPFYVFATQNPIELEGTYPLPEAQLDRFMFKILVGYLSEDEELQVAMQTTSSAREAIEKVFSAADMRRFKELVRLVPIAEPIARYAVRLAQASRPSPQAPEFVRKWVGWGAGTRASQYLILASKARALLNNRFHVACEDIEAVATPVLRHRILTNFRAEADGVDVETVIQKLLEAVARPASGLH